MMWRKEWISLVKSCNLESNIIVQMSIEYLEWQTEKEMETQNLINEITSNFHSSLRVAGVELHTS